MATFFSKFKAMVENQAQNSIKMMKYNDNTKYIAQINKKKKYDSEI